jgi:hypothetical protein
MNSALGFNEAVFVVRCAKRAEFGGHFSVKATNSENFTNKCNFSPLLGSILE